MQAEPNVIMPWFMFWAHMVTVDPLLLAVIIAILESLIALSLLLGFARKPMYIIGGVVSIGIWSVAEGFGGPYGSGATDIGAAIMYVFVFAALWGLEQFSTPLTPWTLDALIAKKWSFWNKVGIWKPEIPTDSELPIPSDGNPTSSTSSV